jgi:hypothetical protein
MDFTLNRLVLSRYTHWRNHSKQEYSRAGRLSPEPETKSSHRRAQLRRGSEEEAVMVIIVVVVTDEGCMLETPQNVKPGGAEQVVMAVWWQKKVWAEFEPWKAGTNYATLGRSEIFRIFGRNKICKIKRIFTYIKANGKPIVSKNEVVPCSGYDIN